MLNISNIFAGLALLVSGVTFWFTLLRRGTVKMTQPAFVFFSLDGANFRGPPKVATVRSIRQIVGHSLLTPNPREAGN